MMVGCSIVGVRVRRSNYFTEMCSGSDAGSYLRLIDCVYHSTLGVRVIKKKKRRLNLPGAGFSLRVASVECGNVQCAL